MEAVALATALGLGPILALAVAAAAAAAAAVAWFSRSEEADTRYCPWDSQLVSWEKLSRDELHLA